MVNIIQTKIVNRDTGEVVSSRENILKTLYKKGYLYLNNTSKCVRISPKQPFPESLSRLDQGYWINILMMSDQNVLPPTKELAEHLSLSVRRTYLLIQRLHTCDMLKKQGRQWFANPLYGFHGKIVSPELFNLFRDELTPVIPSWAVKEYLGDLGE